MTDTTAPKDPRQIAAEIEIAEANARKAAAEATAAQVANLIPDISKAATSTLTAPSTPPPIATVAAYRALEDVGRTISQQLPPTGAVWIVPDGEFLTAVDTYDAVTSELKRLTKLSADAVTTVTAGNLEFVGPTIALAAAAVPLLISLFATSRTVVTAGVNLDFKAAAAAVAAADAKRPVSVLGITPPVEGGLRDLVIGLQGARDELDKALVEARGEWSASSGEAVAAAEAEAWKVVLTEHSKLENANVGDIIGHITGSVQKANEERVNTAKHGYIIKSCEQLLQTVDEVLQRVSAFTGAALAAQCALGAALKNAHVLVLQVSYSGAETDYEHKVGDDRALHLGSSVVTWYLLVKDGAKPAQLKAGIEYAHDSAITYVGDSQVIWATRD